MNESYVSAWPEAVVIIAVFAIAMATLAFCVWCIEKGNKDD